ncbi:GNAT family N-acetyltransferase [bacterium]|nr:GNAT family N-acetyltransferase [bacterium]
MSDIKTGLPCGSQIVKLASTQEEKEQAYRLRYRVFNEELKEGIPENEKTGMDTDYFDQFCDHLLVIEEERVIGTYRLLPGPQRPKEGFYTQSEFDISKLPFNMDLMVELGRACIDPVYRKRSTLMSLFWALHQYAEYKGSQFFMGCGSLPLMSSDDAEATFKELIDANRIDHNIEAAPLAGNQFKGDASKGKAQVPPLVAMYLEFGAKVLGRPAYDPVFKCYDLLVYFDMKNLSEWGEALLEKFDRRLASQASDSAGK